MKVYLDNAATTKVHSKVIDEMLPYLYEEYGNPSALHDMGTNSMQAIDIARERIAKVINANPEEIYFTSGATESNNWVINSFNDGHIITSMIEHPSIYNTVVNYNVDYLKPNKYGEINPEDIKSLVKENTKLISVMAANNEIGTIQDIVSIGKIAHENNILFHTDATQAFGHIDIDVKKMNIDLLSASGHKFYGPKGIGFLYIKNGIKLKSFMVGGHQEDGFRAGTYNTPGIVGLGKAAEIAYENLNNRYYYNIKLKNYLIDRIISEIPNTKLIGDRTNRLPNNVCIGFKNIPAEQILMLLNFDGIYVGSGSACSTGTNETSYVLKAINLEDEYINSCIRFSLSDYSTKNEIDYTVNTLKRIIERLS